MHDIRIDRLRFRTSFLRYDEVEPARTEHNCERTKPLDVDDWLDVEVGHHVLIDGTELVVQAIHIASSTPAVPDHTKIESGRQWVRKLELG